MNSFEQTVATALKVAVQHIEHMAAWISEKQAGYVFEAIGEDFPGIRRAMELAEAIAADNRRARHLRPASEWHHELGPVLWWRFPIVEPPYVGTPDDLGQTVEIVARYNDLGDVTENTRRYHIGGWPGYHTHFTPIPMPAAPVMPRDWTKP